MNQLLKLIKDFHLWAHIGLGMLCWAYVGVVFGHRSNFWWVVTGLFVSIELVQAIRRELSLPKSDGTLRVAGDKEWFLDTILDLVADYFGILLGWIWFVIF